jgi:hypothetical protein
MPPPPPPPGYREEHDGPPSYVPHNFRASGRSDIDDFFGGDTRFEIDESRHEEAVDEDFMMQSAPTRNFQGGGIVKALQTFLKRGKKFTSEIDWSKWNKAIPEDKALLEEYHAIEEMTKRNGTWMKNPDGSDFVGSPEQFVQQQSDNFKAAFGVSKLLNPDGSPMIVYHGSAKKFDQFDPKRFMEGDIYPFGMTLTDAHKIDKSLPLDLFNFNRSSSHFGDDIKLYDPFDAAIHNQQRGITDIRPLGDAYEIVFPNVTQVKSSIGNVGTFDLTNPNIYKQYGGDYGIHY